MKKLLFQFDTDTHPSAFDTIVAYDGGADCVILHGGLNADNISTLVEGIIFTRAAQHKKNTAIFVGGNDMLVSQELFLAVQKCFLPDFKVSVMLDSNGSNTTACAIVAQIAANTSLVAKEVVILGGTGSVGQRTAAMFALEGAKVTITSRHLADAKSVCAATKARFGVQLNAIEANNCTARGESIKTANIVLATGASGVELLKPEHWINNHNLEIIADTNTIPPLGIGGIEIFDKARLRHDKKTWGSIGLGGFKLALHRACIAKLFTSNKHIFDTELIFKLAKTMA